MIVVNKPSGWEVDGATTDFNNFIGQRLSIFVQTRGLPEERPLSYDDKFNYGFIHRLDVPSSGLILTGTVFEGLYHIRWQLNSHVVRREYFIVCHEFLHTCLRIVNAKIDIRAALTNERATITTKGKPARTCVMVVAHSLFGRQGVAEVEAISLTGIRIHTGRRHQIRVHLRHCGYAPAADGRYPQPALTIRPSQESTITAHFGHILKV